MFLKAQTIVHGVAQDIFVDPNRDWVAIRFTPQERALISQLGDNQVFILAPIKQLQSNPKAVDNWAQQWPNRYFAGSHKPPEGGLLLPGHIIKNQDGNS